MYSKLLWAHPLSTDARTDAQVFISVENGKGVSREMVAKEVEATPKAALPSIDTMDAVWPHTAVLIAGLVGLVGVLVFWYKAADRQRPWQRGWRL